MAADDRPCFAALDFGSNSTLLSVACMDSAGTLREEIEKFCTTRLGSGVDETGFLAPRGIDKSIAAADQFLQFLRLNYRNRNVLLVTAATSAVRDARNRRIFLHACLELFGTEPLILTGEEEAETVFLGAASSLPADCECVVIDIGGGSSEVAVGTPGACKAACSLQVGCVRLAELFNLKEEFNLDQLNSARKYVRRQCEAYVERVLLKADRQNADPGVKVVVTGGTATTLASFHEALTNYDRCRVHGFRATERYVSGVLERLSAVSAAQRAAMPGLPADRAEVWPAGLVILSELLRYLHKNDFTVSTRGLRFGLIKSLAQGEIEDEYIVNP